MVIVSRVLQGEAGAADATVQVYEDPMCDEETFSAQSLDRTRDEGSSGRQLQPHPYLEEAAFNSLQLMPLKTFPAAIRGVIQSELNYSVILQWVVTMDPEPVLSWTFSGVPCGMGEKLFIRRLSCEQLGTYMCIATNSKKQLVSEPVTISLPKPIMQPTEAEPMEPDPTLSLSGGSAIGLLAAGILGAGALIAGMCFIIIQSLRWVLCTSLSTWKKKPIP
eukprot:XP_016881808.1 immunoglobulin superfamily member 23 isoform X3 [Homo sapiens]